jgi:hypothetical protein
MPGARGRSVVQLSHAQAGFLSAEVVLIALLCAVDICWS